MLDLWADVDDTGVAAFALADFPCDDSFELFAGGFDDETGGLDGSGFDELALPLASILEEEDGVVAVGGETLSEVLDAAELSDFEGSPTIFTSISSDFSFIFGVEVEGSGLTSFGLISALLISMMVSALEV